MRAGQKSNSSPPFFVKRIFMEFIIFSWDEWVPENRVLKYNEANVQLQKEIKQKVETYSKNTKKASKSNKKM